MDQTHSTIWILILSFIKTSLPGNLSTPHSPLSHFNPTKAHQIPGIQLTAEGKDCQSHSSHQAGEDNRAASTRGWDLASFVMIKGDHHFMAPLPGPSGRWWQLRDRHISKTRKHSHIVTVPRSQGYTHKTFPDY